MKTNVNYCVAVSIFVRCEKSKFNKKALTIIKSWNITGSPQYFVTDHCKVEYNVITKIYNYIYNFHLQ